MKCVQQSVKTSQLVICFGNKVPNGLYPPPLMCTSPHLLPLPETMRRSSITSKEQEAIMWSKSGAKVAVAVDFGGCSINDEWVSMKNFSMAATVDDNGWRCDSGM
ncbi:hypothetical protein RIF29_04191 [Crotalaria pallida]|uniref:Uncharacterized protein n=1 Tax=Crotalaria pallida TaxID=3830 RepID=A0AAN9J1I3_CROPI